MDHEPPREVATEVSEPTEPAPVATSAAPPATDSDLDERNRLVVRMIAAAAVVALIAAFSWQLAALLSIALVGIAAVRSSLGGRIKRGAG
jgi:hypothetical protein